MLQRLLESEVVDEEALLEPNAGKPVEKKKWGQVRSGGGQEGMCGVLMPAQQCPREQRFLAHQQIMHGAGTMHNPTHPPNHLCSVCVFPAAGAVASRPGR